MNEQLPISDGIRKPKEVKKIAPISVNIGRNQIPWPQIAPEAMQRQSFKSRGELIILKEYESPIFTFVPKGDIFPNYSALGRENAPDFEDLDSGVTKRWEIFPPEETADLGEVA